MKRWPTKPLEQIAVLYGGGTPSRANPTFWGGDIHWVTPTDLPMPDEGISVVSKTKEKITQIGLDNSSVTIVPKGTVLFSSRATIGKVAIADMPLTTNQGFANFVPNPEMSSRFLAYALWFHRADIARLSGSTTFKEVSRGTLRKYHLPVPPLVEQEYVVKLLDEADELRKLRAQADGRTAAIIPALFHEMFGDPASNPNHWTKVQIRDAVNLINGRAFKPTEWSKTGLPIIRIQNLKDPTADFNLFAGEFEPKHLVKKGALLIAWAGQLVSFGVHIWDGPEGVLNQHIFKVELRIPIEIEYLRHALSLVVESAKSRFQGSEMKHLTRGTLDESEILTPPLALQKQFAKRVTEIRELETHQTTSSARLEALFQSMLHRAFNGDL